MEEKLSSRWSCSTITTLAAGTNAKTASRLRCRKAPVSPGLCCAKRAYRAGGDMAVPKIDERSSSEPIVTLESDGDGDAVRPESVSGKFHAPVDLMIVTMTFTLTCS